MEGLKEKLRADFQIEFADNALLETALRIPHMRMNIVS